MGRFYKATPAQFIDNKMYETPFDEMAKVIGTLDKNIDETYEMAGDIEKAMDIENLDVDNPAVKNRFKHFENLTNEVTKEIDKDPLSYRKQSGKLRKISRDLSNDIKTGELGAAQEQFKEYNTMVADIDKRDDLKSETKDLYKKYLLHQYQGLNYDQGTGRHNRVKDYEKALTGEVLDETKYLSDIAKDFEFWSVGGGSSRVGKVGGFDGDVLLTTSGNVSIRSADRVKTEMVKDLENRDYVNSRKQVYDMKIAMGDITPDMYGENGELKTSEQMAIEDQNKLIERGINKLTGKKGHYNTTASGLSGLKDKDALPGMGAEVVDNVGTKANREKVARSEKDLNVKLEQGLAGKGMTLPTLLDNIKNAKNPEETLNSYYEKLKGGAIRTKVDFVEYLNLKAKENVVRDKDAITMKDYNNYNSSEQNQFTNIQQRSTSNELSPLVYKDSEGKDVRFNTVSELVEHNANVLANKEAGVNTIFIAPTAQGEAPDFYKTMDFGGTRYLVNKEGAPIQDDEGNKFTRAEDVPLDYADQLFLDSKKVSQYTTSGNMFKAGMGELSIQSHDQYNLSGQIIKKAELVHKSDLLEYDLNTGKYIKHTIESISEPSRFGIKPQ